MFKKISNCIVLQNGQTMLIVVLAIVIALTVGLSVVSRSITSVKVATQDANSQKALAAAEAGIERMLQELTTGQNEISSTFNEGSSSYTTVASSLDGTKVLLAGGNEIEKDVGIDLWFIEHNEADKTPNYNNTWDGTIRIYWGTDENDCNNAALEVAILSGSIDSPTLKRYALDPCSSRADVNNFDEDLVDKTGGVLSSRTFKYHTADIPITDGLFARIIPLYTGDIIGVEVDSSSLEGLPSQGSVISSTGMSGDTEREIVVFQGYPSLPVEYFPNNFFYYSL